MHNNENKKVIKRKLVFGVTFKRAKQEGRLPDVNLTEIMISWTKQKGHPVINIKRISSTQIQITQNRFVLDTTRSISSLNELDTFATFSRPKLSKN